MNMQLVMDNLKKMSISNINKHHQKIIDFFFSSVWYDEDIIMGLHIISLYDIMRKIV
jgi:hypothetical protein